MSVSRILKSATIRAKRRLDDLSPAEASRARQDREALIQRFAPLADFDDRVEPVERYFEPDHADYCSRVGHPNHAASVELVGFMVLLIHAVRPQRVIDLGSGFTSYALRLMAESVDEGRYTRPPFDRLGGAAADLHPFEVTSVDDSPEWLERTRAYLAEKGVSRERTHVWRDFWGETEKGRYDIVLHDMGTMGFREETLRQAVSLARPGGVVVLDDMHKPSYRKEALAMLEADGRRVLSAKAFTRDELTRYAYVALP